MPHSPQAAAYGVGANSPPALPGTLVCPGDMAAPWQRRVQLQHAAPIDGARTWLQVRRAFACSTAGPCKTRAAPTRCSNHAGLDGLPHEAASIRLSETRRGPAPQLITKIRRSPPRQTSYGPKLVELINPLTAPTTQLRCQPTPHHPLVARSASTMELKVALGLMACEARKGSGT